MGTTGSGKFEDYAPGKGDEDRCDRAFTAELEDVATSAFYRDQKVLPDVGVAVKVRVAKRVAVVTSGSGQEMGHLPTEFNYLRACIKAGRTYEGVVQSSVYVLSQGFLWILRRRPDMTAGPILIVGEVVIDVAGLGSQAVSIRPGGISHACRALAASAAQFDVAYVAPSYAWDELQRLFADLGARSSFLIAETLGAPVVIIVQHPEEATRQGYELLLRDRVRFRMMQDAIDRLAQSEYADALLIPGNFPLPNILRALGRSRGQVHIDWANAADPLPTVAELGRPARTIILSTSSSHFLDYCGGRFTGLASAVIPTLAESVLLKENRGGCRYQLAHEAPIGVGAQLRAVRHSVGVGDCFDAIFIARSQIEETTTALRRAAWCAAEYASTTSTDAFVAEARRSFALSPEDLADSPGILLSWEDRPALSVYIAGPDFSGQRTASIDAVESALQYHNFHARRPVREIGQVMDNAPEAERARVCDADLAVLEAAAAVVGVYVDNDPGTLIELGYAAGKGIPTILYDPERKARNLMLTGVCHRIAHNLDELMVEVFRILGARTA